MPETAMWVLALVTGGALGVMFFGGLWWTVRRGLLSRHPARWLLGSLLVRTSLAVAGFLLVSDGRWQRLLLCLLGFVITRGVVTRQTRSPGQLHPDPARDEPCT